MDSSQLSDKNFEKLSKIIHDTWGVKMPASKKGMLQTRLTKRLRSLNIESLEQYCKYLFSPEGTKNEKIHLIDVVSTNKTDFFREPESFHYLVQNILPELVIERG
ncbi:MAG: chemotaxis protein CheR, partial [bacterium]|nr:chemotaxis protein CheR [bacterium]